MADAHIDVIDDNAEVICRMFVRTQQYKIFDRVAFDRNLTKNSVVVGYAAFGHSETDGAFVVIREALINQSLRGFPVQIQTLRLVIRTLVPMQSEPRHRVENTACHILVRSLDIGILNAKDKGAAMLSR